MKDINFFSVYFQKNASTKTQVIRFSFLGLGIFLIIGALYFTLFLRLGHMQDQAAEIEKFLATDEVNQSIRTAEAYNNNLIMLDSYEMNAVEYRELLELGDMFNSEFMETIAKAIPVNSYISRFSYSADAISMIFVVPNLSVSAQLDDELHKLDIFKSIIAVSATADETTGLYLVEFSAVAVGQPFVEGVN